MKIRIFDTKTALYGSVDVNNICNLHCTHCYWWLDRKEGEQGLIAQDWFRIVCDTFKKQRIFFATLVGGEPALRPKIIEVYCEEMPRSVHSGQTKQKVVDTLQVSYQSFRQEQDNIMRYHKSLLSPFSFLTVVIFLLRQNPRIHQLMLLSLIFVDDRRDIFGRAEAMPENFLFSIKKVPNIITHKKKLSIKQQVQWMILRNSWTLRLSPVEFQKNRSFLERLYRPSVIHIYP